MSVWTKDFPTYVSREYDGARYRMTSPFWLVMLLYLLALVNAVLWGGIGLVVAVEKIVNAVAGLV